MARLADAQGDGARITSSGPDFEMAINCCFHKIEKSSKLPASINVATQSFELEASGREFSLQQGLVI
jgi:hypothetical protein